MSAAQRKTTKTTKKTTSKAKKAPARPAETLSARRSPPRSQARAVPLSRGDPRRAASAPRVVGEEPAATAATVAPAAPTKPARSNAPVEVCPRCGTATFGLEERTRWEGRRTVRYTVLVCERGHTFAHPVLKRA